MKRKMRRLFAFLLALMLFMPAGIPAEAGTARADTETKADLLPQVSIVSSEPDANGVYTMDFSVKQDELLYADRIVNKAVFVFTYDTDSIVPVNAVDGTGIDGIPDKDTTTTSPFVLASGDFKISKVAWLVDETNRRTTVGVIAETTNTDGLAMTQPAKMFSFSYRVKTATPKQGMLKIESDPSVLQRFFESYDTTDYAQQAGILISHVKSGYAAVNKWFNHAKGYEDSIVLTKFTYPGCDETQAVAEINLYMDSTYAAIQSRVYSDNIIATKKNADGAKVPFSDADVVEWSFACTDPAVEKARLADPEESVALTGTEKGERVLRIKTTAGAYHRSTCYESPNTNHDNVYNVTIAINGTPKTCQFKLIKNEYDRLYLDSCTVTGEGMAPYTYYFPAEVEGGPTELVSQGLAIIPLPASGVARDYTFTFNFHNVFGEEAMPEGNEQFLIKKFTNEFGNAGDAGYAHQGGNVLNLPQRGILKWNNTELGIGTWSEGKANKLTLSFTNKTGQMTSGGYTIYLQAQNRPYHTGKNDGPDYRQPYSWKMNFFITNILYTWPAALTNDFQTPLVMKPDQTYQGLLDELVSRGTAGNPFFSKEASDVFAPDEKYAGEVTVLTPEGKPTPGKDNYVTFRFTVTDDKNEGKYKGKYIDFPRLVKVATLPAEDISATITKVDGSNYDNKPLELEATKSQLAKAADLQDLGFPSSVTLSWDGGSADIAGSDLKFDAALADLQTLSVGETKDVHFQSPASNINLANGLTVKVKIVPTGLGGGTVTLGGAGGGWTYTGKPITPEPTVTLGGATLIKDTDYTVEYKDNVNAGTGKIIVTGKGDYSGTIEENFTINKASLPGVIVDGAALNTDETKYTAEVGGVLTPKFKDGLNPNAADWVWKEKDTGALVSNKRVYVPKAGDAGKEIYVEAKAKPEGNYLGTAASLPVKVIIPISGSVYIKTAVPAGGGGTSAPIGSGTKLTAVITPDYPGVDWDYQWKKDGQDIPGATDPTYTLPAGVGANSKITVDVTPKDDSPAAGSLKSADGITVGKKTLGVEKVEVTVTAPGGGSGPKPGDKLTASVTPAGGSGTPEDPPYKFVWIKNGEPIPGEEGPEYILKPEDKGQEITVVAAPKDDGYTGAAPAGNSPVSVPPTEPAPPKNVTVTPNQDNNSITVTWEPPEDDGGEPIEEYKVVVKDGDNNTVAEVPVDHDKTQCVIPDLKEDEEYKVEVTAANGKGGSDPAVPSGPDNPDDPDDPDNPKPTIKPGSGGGWIFFPSKPAPNPSPSGSPSPSPDPSGSPKPTPDASACPRDDTCPIAPFPDANPKAWYHDGLHFCTGENLMNGYDTGLLGPNDQMTRAQLAMILYNMENRPDNSGVSGFSDVPEGYWYAKAITWAASNQVMIGYKNGRFGPNDPVTREQLAATLYRYAGSPPAQGSLERFTDWEEVSPYAKESLIWAVSKDLVRGVGSDRLSPRSASTRAQIGTIIYRYCKLISYRDA